VVPVAEPEMPDVPERIITEEDAKIFTVQSTVFVFDDQRQRQMAGDWTDCKVEFVNPVTVLNAEDKIIGCANLELVGKELVATFSLDASTPERLDIETGAIKLFPFLHSQTECACTDYVNKFTKTLIQSIQLTPNRVNDDRIECLGT
jgi:hypothetical protein